jgi:DNA-binding GntR family transcriptional regulator
VTEAEQARDHILNHAPDRFTFAQVAAALPDISAPTIRNAFNRLRSEGRLSVGRGRGAEWTRRTT